MNLYIEIENGKPKNHPAFEENLIQAFGFIPSNWEIFNRIEQPILSIYELIASEEPTYEQINGVWSDVWHTRNMTVEEKTVKQQAVIASFNSRYQSENWSAWSLNEDTCKMTSPIPKPDQTEDKEIRWCGSENNWKEVPLCPIDDYQYKFDYFSWQWIKI
jgi:hypothetical protein